MSTDSSKNKIPVNWNPWAGLGAAVGIFLGAQLIVGVLISSYPALMHWSNQRANNWLNNTVGVEFIYILLTEAAVVAGVYWFLRRYKDGLRAIGLRRPKRYDPLLGLMALPVYYLVFLVAVAIISWFVPSLNVSQKQQLGFNNVHGGIHLIMTFISLVVLPPIAEEIVFRGLIYTSLRKALPLSVAVIGTSALFAAGHLAEGGSSGPLYIAGIDTFVLSLALIYLRQKTGRLWASMTLHGLKNTVAFIALFAPLMK